MLKSSSHWICGENSNFFNVYFKTLSVRLHMCAIEVKWENKGGQYFEQILQYHHQSPLSFKNLNY